MEEAEAPLQQEQASIISEVVLAAIVDKLLLAAIFVFIVALANYVVYVAFGSFPVVKMGTSALTSFLLVLVAIPLLIRYVAMIFMFLKREKANTDKYYEGMNYIFAAGSGVVCVFLAIGVVNSVIYANELSSSQQFLLLVEFITFGFQLRRILLHK